MTPPVMTWPVACVTTPDHANAVAPSTAADRHAAVAVTRVGVRPVSAVSITACHGSSWIHTGAGVAVVVSNSSSPSRIALSCRARRLVEPLLGPRAIDADCPTLVCGLPCLGERGRRSRAVADRLELPSEVRDRRCVARALLIAGTTDQASHHPPFDACAFTVARSPRLVTRQFRGL
jgi:hypothetical protein